ncbi:hypothetical protein BDF21DRAFT_467008 [Thamnidium elegans]|uniref:Uncharacterized protein n=1 Tax=Thamnidium elegans TaxID=101142 RepID=A0A8H7SPE7_9FUNG|nr:hypothetical protein INT48_008923 [Thamnidium elegans]KAI8063117.1 hypothetical protein BDF21DRAFT_467008 [Thamnidium elegans]
MVRTIVIVSAVLALIATVSAGPLISAKADRHIGTGPITLKNIANDALQANNAHVHDALQRISVAGGKVKRDEGEGAPVRITKAVGVKGNKKMAKPKTNKGTTPKH